MCEFLIVNYLKNQSTRRVKKILEKNFVEERFEKVAMS